MAHPPRRSSRGGRGGGATPSQRGVIGSHQQPGGMDALQQRGIVGVHQRRGEMAPSTRRGCKAPLTRRGGIVTSTRREDLSQFRVRTKVTLAAVRVKEILTQYAFNAANWGCEDIVYSAPDKLFTGNAPHQHVDNARKTLYALVEAGQSRLQFAVLNHEGDDDSEDDDWENEDTLETTQPLLSYIRLSQSYEVWKPKLRDSDFPSKSDTPFILKDLMDRFDCLAAFHLGQIHVGGTEEVKVLKALVELDAIEQKHERQHGELAIHLSEAGESHAHFLEAKKKESKGETSFQPLEDCERECIKTLAPLGSPLAEAVNSLYACRLTRPSSKLPDDKLREISALKNVGLNDWRDYGSKAFGAERNFGATLCGWIPSTSPQCNGTGTEVGVVKLDITDLKCMRLEMVMLEALRRARTFSGVVQMQIDIGLAIIEEGKQLDGSPLSTEEWKSIGLRLENGYAPCEPFFHKMFTKLFTDVGFIINLKYRKINFLFEENAFARSSIYEFNLSKHGKSFILEMDIDSFEYQVKGETEVIGQGLSYYPHCTWDSMLSVTGTSIPSQYHEDVKKFLATISKPHGGRSLELWYTAQADLEVDSVWLRRRSWHKSTKAPDIALCITEVQILDMLHDKQDPSKCAATKVIPPTVGKDDRIICYELSLVPLPVQSVLAENMRLQPGETSTWTPEDILKDGLLYRLAGLAKDVVERADSILLRDYFGVEEKLKAEQIRRLARLESLDRQPARTAPTYQSDWDRNDWDDGTPGFFSR